MPGRLAELYQPATGYRVVNSNPARRLVTVHVAVTMAIMSKSLRVLIIEDDPAEIALLEEELRRSDYEPTLQPVDTQAALRAALEAQPWDVVLSDYALPHLNALKALAVMKEGGHDLPFLIISSAVDESLMAAAMDAGAHDYIRHSHLARLAPALERELRAAQDRRARREAEQAVQEAEARYRALVEQIPAALHVMALDVENTTLSIGPQIERMLGFSLAEWQADPHLWRRQLHPDDRAHVLAELARLYAPGAEPFIVEYRLIGRDGRAVWIHDETILVRDADGHPVQLNSVKLDITTRKQAEADVVDIHEKLAGWVTELERHNREISLLNDLGGRLQGCLTLEEAYGAVAEYAQLLFPATAGALYASQAAPNQIEVVIDWGRPVLGEPVFALDGCWALRRGRPHAVEDPAAGQVCPHLGEEADERYLCLPLMAQGEALGVLHLRQMEAEVEAGSDLLSDEMQRLAGTCSEQIALALANLKLRRTLQLQSSQDSVTGLFNRRHLEEAMEREVLRAVHRQEALSLMLVEVAGLSAIESKAGHAAVEAVLRQVANLLKTQTRSGDVAGRLGDDQFLVLLPESPFGLAEYAAEALQEAAARLASEHDGRTLSGVTLQIGVAATPEHGSTAEALLRAAREALRQVQGAAPEAAASPPAGTEPRRLTVGLLSLDTQTFELTIGEQVVRPTPAEFELLQFLMRHAGKVFTSEQLLRDVWHYPPDTGSRETVRAHVKNLRGKIEPDPHNPVYLKTVGRFGYTISAESSE